MTLWNEVSQEPTPDETDRLDGAVTTLHVPRVPRRPEQRVASGESVIAADVTIEGKIEGAGHVRIAGCFKGDVQVDGNLTIEPGARVSGQLRAENVIIAGELQGNVDAATRVELLETGAVIGDLKAVTLTVAAGSRMRGNVEFGWEDKGGDKHGDKLGSGIRNGSHV
jgi:cytoskeletal protein CcmA (bactofilin family)